MKSLRIRTKLSSVDFFDSSRGDLKMAGKKNAEKNHTVFKSTCRSTVPFGLETVLFLASMPFL